MATDEHIRQLLPSVYPQLRRMAAAQMQAQLPGQTIQPTALLHEAWIRLSTHQTRTWWADQNKLVAAAAVTMRRILIDRARKRAEVKHGGDQVRVSLDAAEASVPADSNDKLLLIHEALCLLEKDHPKHANVVILKIFGGLSIQEISTEMGISIRTVHRLWEQAKALLYEEIVTPK